LGMITMPSKLPNADRWHILDDDNSLGPMSWQEAMHMAHSKRLTTKALIRNEEGMPWTPITYFVYPGYLINVESEGLMPGKWDLLFYGGLGLFLVGIFVVFVNVALFALILILSCLIESYAVYMDTKTKRRSASGTIGNVMAIGWIIVQVLFGAFMIAAMS